VQAQQRLKVAQRERAPVSAQRGRRLARRVAARQSGVRLEECYRVVQAGEGVQEGGEVGLGAGKHERLEPARGVQVVQRELGGGHRGPHLVSRGAQGLEWRRREVRVVPGPRSPFAPPRVPYL
jgi:hypothetical protein